MKKLVVVTGGSKGIGRAIVERFGANDFDVVTCSRNEADLSQMSKEIKQKHPSAMVYFRPADLSKKEDVLAFAAFVKEINRPISVLVNNAGLFIPGQMHNEEEGALETMIQTNLYSAYHLTRALVGDMKTKKKGHIFTICSTASIIPYVNGGSYCISKFALLGMTKVLREEMKEHDVRVTAILPGATYTASWEGVELPIDRFMKSEDVAEAVFSAYNMSKSTVVEEILVRPQLGDL